MTEPHAPLVDAFSEILDQERQAILDGNIDGLARLTDAKEGLLIRLQAAQPPEHSLTRLRAASARNTVMLAATAQGIKAAGARLRELTEGPAPLATYDPSGHRQLVGDAVRTLEKRA